MTDLPEGDEGLSWIVSRDPTKLLLIPGLRSASLIAAAAGDEEALECVRLTAQHFVGYVIEPMLNALDRACLAASELQVGTQAYRSFFGELRRVDPQLVRIFDDCRNHTRALLEQAAAAGELSAMKWLHAICPGRCLPRSSMLMSNAAAHGHLAVLRYLRSLPEPALWDKYTALRAVPNLECIKWLLSPDVPGCPCPCNARVLSRIAEFHGSSALKWFHVHGKLPAGLWNSSLPKYAAQTGNFGMLQWLIALRPPVQWDTGAAAAAAKRGDISMLSWMRQQDVPVPWDEEVTAAAAQNPDISMLKWLRAQDPPCPWNERTCERAAEGGFVDTLIWLRAQTPPCPFNMDCYDAAVCRCDVSLLEWLLEAGCPFEPDIALSVCTMGEVGLLQKFHAAGCLLDDACLHQAALAGDLKMLEWLCEQGCQLTGDLYHSAVAGDNIYVLKFLHRRKVPMTDCILNEIWCEDRPGSMLMGMADIGMKLPAEVRQQVMEARRAHCTFYGLIRWSRQASSDPRWPAHPAFNILAADSSGQALLTRLSLLPPELIRKIAIAAELQHDILD